MSAATHASRHRFNRTMIVLFSWAAALACVLLAFSAGCATTGPDTEQSVTGQRARNTPLNTQSIIEPGEGGATWNSTAAGNIDMTLFPGGIKSSTSGAPTRTVYITRPDGTNVALRSQSDITANGVKVMDPVTGAMIASVDSFSTSVSVPLDALGRVQAAMQATIQRLAEVQGISYADAYRAVVDSIEQLQPSIAQLLKGLLPAAP